MALDEPAESARREIVRSIVEIVIPGSIAVAVVGSALMLILSPGQYLRAVPGAVVVALSIGTLWLRRRQRYTGATHLLLATMCLLVLLAMILNGGVRAPGYSLMPDVSGASRIAALPTIR